MFTKGFISNIERDNVFVWFGDTTWNAGSPNPSDYRIYQWAVPTGTKMIHIVGCGGGGAGGSGANTVTNSASGGGAGGGGGAMTSIFYPAELIPSNLFIAPGFGGLGNNSAVVGATGGTSYVGYNPSPSTAQQLMNAQGGRGGGFGTTANGASGAGGAGSSVATSDVGLITLGGICGFSSRDGGSGGISAIPSKTGLNTTWTMGGGGGGNVNASNNPFSGGIITIDTLGSINLNQTISQSQDGFFTTSPTWITTGGGGGQGNSAGPGGNGGNGGIGSGGGGGGGGRSTGSRSFGGSGGPGFVIITCW